MTAIRWTRSGRNGPAAPTVMFGLLVDLGERLGLFEDLATRGAATPPELASRNGLDEGGVSEWLRAMVAAGRVECDSITHRFALPGAST